MTANNCLLKTMTMVIMNSIFKYLTIFFKHLNFFENEENLMLYVDRGRTAMSFESQILIPALTH